MSNDAANGRQTLVVESRIREYVKGKDPEARISAEFITAIDNKVSDLVDEAIKRTKANSRKTLQPSDV